MVEYGPTRYVGLVPGSTLSRRLAYCGDDDKTQAARLKRDLASVQSLPGLADLPLDAQFGLVPINSRESLYVVRTDSVDDLDRRCELTPEILRAYGDVRISSS